MDERILKYCDGQLSKQDQECLLKEAQNYNPQIEMFARFKMKSSFHKTKRII